MRADDAQRMAVGAGDARAGEQHVDAGVRPKRLARGLRLGQHRLRMAMHAGADVGHRETARRALQQAHAEIGFQLADAAAEAGLGNAQRPLGRGEPESPILRRFELALLQDLGYEAGLAHEGDSGEPVRPEGRYLYIIERGPVRLETLEEEGAVLDAAALGEQPLLSGQTLLDMAADDFSRAETLAQSKQLLRMLINHTLGGQPLQSRRVLKELQEL